MEIPLFHAKIGTIKAETARTQQKQKRLRRGGKNTQKNCTKKGLNDPDKHDGVITHLEPDILECKVKWALGSITTNKASGSDIILAEIFKILKAIFLREVILKQLCKILKGFIFVYGIRKCSSFILYM